MDFSEALRLRCTKNYLSFSSGCSCYYKINNSKTWEEARKWCRKEFDDLADPLNYVEFIKKAKLKSKLHSIIVILICILTILTLAKNSRRKF